MSALSKVIPTSQLITQRCSYSTLGITMEQVNFGYSMKNIPIASRKEHILGLTHSTREFVNNLRWRSKFALSSSKPQDKKETFGLKSSNRCEPIAEMKEFEDKLQDMVKTVKFRDVSNSFQNKLRTDINTIKNEPKIFMKADKTTNYYKVDTAKAEELIERDITKEYKKASLKTIKDIQSEAVSLATELGVADRIYQTSENQAYNTLKDHKDNFRNNPKCRLINPTKPETGKIAKCKLEQITKIVKEKSGLTQWKNTHEFLGWFNGLSDKSNSTFLQFDICNFYPSITEKLILKSIAHAAQYTDISEEDKILILHTSKSLLYHKGQAWVKKGRSTVDVTMGCFDGAEKCDLVGLYLLSLLVQLGIIVGLFRDDGAAVTTLPQKRQTS